MATKTLKSLLKSRIKERIIEDTGINRNRFYIGLENPVIFTTEEIKAIARAAGLTIKEVNETIMN